MDKREFQTPSSGSKLLIARAYKSFMLSDLLLDTKSGLVDNWKQGA